MNLHELDQAAPLSNNQPPATHAPVVFHPALAINLMMTLVMIASIAYALERFLPMLVALPVAVALASVFGHMVHRALDADTLGIRRIAAAAAAALIFLVTCGLSYGSLYAALFAEQSALKYFEESRRPLMAKLNAQLANAETARQALQAWADDSKAKAEAEANTGGSCPTKAESSGIRGPIAKWRESEMQIAADLAKVFTQRLNQVRARVDPVRDKLPATFAESLAIGAALNAGVEGVEALAHGAFPSSAADTLKRQSATTISWKNGETFACGDTARNEVIGRAAKAVADLQAGAALEVLKPAIDLRQDREVMIVGLLRGFNLAAGAATFGMLGGFQDDPLMALALRKGTINRETLPFVLAALIELSVALTAAWARERGRVPLPFEPISWLGEARQRRAAVRQPLFGFVLGVWHAAARMLINLFYAVPVAADASTPSHPAVDPQLATRELGWADMLLPWLSYVHDCAYLCIPIMRGTEHARAAARCLDEQGLAVLLASAATWAHVGSSPEFAHRVELLVPDAKLKRFEVYRLSPDTAQAFRLHWLQPNPPSPAGAARRKDQL